MKQRLNGIDVARALAVIGMILVNFKMVFGNQGEGWLKAIVTVFDGKAAATFVVLAGVGIAFATNSAIANKDTQKLKDKKKGLLKRALLLFVIGLSYIAIWPADILHFYGIYMLISLVLLDKKPTVVFITALSMIFIYPLLMFLINYDSGWDFESFEYASFWGLEGFIRNLFYNGFHPVIPWTAFMLIGIWLGRQDLHDDKFVKKALLVSISIFILMKLISVISINALSQGDEVVALELSQILSTSPMPPLPIYMISGSSIAVFIISSCLLISKKFNSHFVIQSLTKTGQLALTFYLAHVVLGMGLVEVLSPTPFGEFSLQFSVIYALLFSLCCIIFAVLWSSYFQQGPFEWIMKKVTN